MSFGSNVAKILTYAGIPEVHLKNLSNPSSENFKFGTSCVRYDLTVYLLNGDMLIVSILPPNAPLWLAISEINSSCILIDPEKT